MAQSPLNQIKKLEAEIIFYEGQVELYMKILRPLVQKLEELKLQLEELEKGE